MSAAVIPAGTTILSVDSAIQITLSQNATATASGVAITVFPWGNGDGSTTFDLPELRAEFIRGWDNGRGIDSGRVFGSAQADEFKSHTHTVAGGVNAASGASWNVPGGISGASGAAGGAETRPLNIALFPSLFH